MRRLRSVGAGLVLAATVAAPAGATLLRNTRPGVVCRSAEALARLTRPDGSSRSTGPQATPADKAAAGVGGCVEMTGGGAILQATETRRNTSVVLFGEPGTVPQPYYAANVDFTPLPAQRGPFADEMRRRCPAKLEPFTVFDSDSELDLLDGFIATLPAATAKRIGRMTEGKCELGWRCEYDAKEEALAKLGLEAQWADHVCKVWTPD